MLNRTPSHICRRLYLPVLLLWVELFTHMKMDALVFLAKLYPSLPTMLKLSSVLGWPVIDWWPYMGEGAFRCSFNLSPNVLAESPKYSSSQCSLLHLYQYIIPLFCYIWSLSFGVIRMFLSVLFPLEHVWMLYLLQIFLILSHRPCIYGI